MVLRGSGDVNSVSKLLKTTRN